MRIGAHDLARFREIKIKFISLLTEEERVRVLTSFTTSSEKTIRSRSLQEKGYMLFRLLYSPIYEGPVIQTIEELCKDRGKIEAAFCA